MGVEFNSTQFQVTYHTLVVSSICDSYQGVEFYPTQFQVSYHILVVNSICDSYLGVEFNPTQLQVSYHILVFSSICDSYLRPGATYSKYIKPLVWAFIAFIKEFSTIDNFATMGSILLFLG